ncbi:hypothetical protein PG993_000011 [Apiospora rasikravindrae]|uniref:Antitoxin protein of toxin-antitoxin system n=1 Tax=Apiospora rasikravindrae TaxID=990691 RepID=A0ABR1UA27_9PEZI
MDFIKKASGSGSGTANQQPAGGAPQQDYGDKAANMLDKKYNGGKLGEAKLEKITDGLRTGYEKATGNKVNPKISN